MSTFPIIAISIAAILVVLLAIIFVVDKRKGAQPVETDYRVFFIIGISWLPLGIATDNWAFLAMGIIFMLVGLANKDKWPEEKKLSELPANERTIRIILILGLALLVVASIALYLLAGQ